MGAVLVHIDLDGDRPHPASLAALAAGRAVASSWGATLYAGLVIHEAAARRAPDATGRVITTVRAGATSLQQTLARAGADKVIAAINEVPVAPLWAIIGAAWHGVLDHLHPRLVLFGADAPSTPELAARTGAKIGARLLTRARATRGDHVEVRDRDGAYVRASDGGAAVVTIGGRAQATARGDDAIDHIVLAISAPADSRVELAGTGPAELGHMTGAVVAIGDDVAGDAQVIAGAQRIAKTLGAHVVGGSGAVRAGVITAGAVVERQTALAPELCIAVGNAAVDLAGTARLVRIGSTGGKGVDGALAPAASVAELASALEGS